MTRTIADKKDNGRGRGRPPLAAAAEGPLASKKGRGFEPGIDAFVRIANGRVNGILAKLNTLSKLSSGKSKYGYADGDVEAIRTVLTAAVNKTCDRLLRKPVAGGFNLRAKRDASA